MNLYTQKKQIPVLLLTGYLGSGKTTLLNRILANRKGIKFAVVVNDIGEVNIDASLIAKDGIVGQTDSSLVALQNGCICCTLKMDLASQLADLTRSGRFDYIVVEASGICEPAPIAQTISTLPQIVPAAMLGAVPYVDSIVTVVDALRMRDEFGGGDALGREDIGEDDLERWARNLFEKEGLQIGARELSRFLDSAGTDMLNIESEADKVISYCYGRPDRVVHGADLDAVCSPLLKDRIFEMTEAISRREKEKALKIYMELCLLQTAPQVILSLLQRQFRQLLMVGEMSAATPAKEIAAYLKVPPFVVSNKFRPCLRLFTRAQLTAALDACVQADLDYRSGKIDAARAVEILILSV